MMSGGIISQGSISSQDQGLLFKLFLECHTLKVEVPELFETVVIGQLPTEFVEFYIKAKLFSTIRQVAAKLQEEYKLNLCLIMPDIGRTRLFVKESTAALPEIFDLNDVTKCVVDLDRVKFSDVIGFKKDSSVSNQLSEPITETHLTVWPAMCNPSLGDNLNDLTYDLPSSYFKRTFDFSKFSVVPVDNNDDYSAWYRISYDQHTLSIFSVPKNCCAFLNVHRTVTPTWQEIVNYVALHHILPPNTKCLIPELGDVHIYGTNFLILSGTKLLYARPPILTHITVKDPYKLLAVLSDPRTANRFKNYISQNIDVSI